MIQARGSDGGGGGDGREDRQPIDWQMTALLFIFPALGGALFGYDIGATSGALVSLKSATTSGTSWCPPSAALRSWEHSPRPLAPVVSHVTCRTRLQTCNHFYCKQHIIAQELFPGTRGGRL